MLAASGTVGQVAVQAAKLLGGGARGGRRAAPRGAAAGRRARRGRNRLAGGRRRSHRRRCATRAAAAPRSSSTRCGASRRSPPSTRWSASAATWRSGSPRPPRHVHLRPGAQLRALDHRPHELRRPGRGPPRAYERMAAHAAAGELTADYESVAARRRARRLGAPARGAGDEARGDAVRRVDSELLLVGSLPADSTEEAFRAGAELFGDLVFALPDGETGPRAAWVGYEREQLARPEPRRRRGRGDRLADRDPAPRLRDAGVRVREGVDALHWDTLAADRRRDRVLRGVHARCATRA